MTKLIELAKVVRSKNAGPLYLTIDIMFDNEQDYERVKKSGILNEKLISKLYQTEEKNVSIVDYPAALSIKITIPRKIISGDIGDTDIYGAQQHAPLIDIIIT